MWSLVLDLLWGGSLLSSGSGGQKKSAGGGGCEDLLGELFHGQTFGAGGVAEQGSGRRPRLQGRVRFEGIESVSHDNASTNARFRLLDHVDGPRQTLRRPVGESIPSYFRTKSTFVWPVTIVSLSPPTW